MSNEKCKCRSLLIGSENSNSPRTIFILKVLEVEDEMRILLQENALTKKTLEQRLKKLTSAFTEIQQDLAET